MGTPQYIWSARAHSCPRYLPEEVGSPSAQTAADLIRSAAIRGHAQPAVAENAVLQGTLWGAVRTGLAQGLASMVEVRWIIHEAGLIEPWILLAGTTSPPPEAAAASERWRASLTGLLPRDYQWVVSGARSDEVDPQFGPVPLDAAKRSPREWCMTRVVRRRLAAHLPRITPMVVPASAPLPEHSSATQHFSSQFFGFEPHVPNFKSAMATPEALDLGIALPIVASLTDSLPDRRRLCAEALSASPAIISFQIWTVSTRSLAQDRHRSDLLRRYWDVLPPPVQEAMVSHLGLSIRDTFNRYHRSPQDLAVVEIRAYAPDLARSRRIGAMLANQNGGLQCFELEDFEQALPIVGARTSSNSELARSASREDVEDRVSDREAWARLVGVRHDLRQGDDDVGFIYGLRELYTAEEAEIILRLPFSFESGLPGINTHLVPPFHTLPRHRLRVRTADAKSDMVPPPSNRIRLGIPYAVESILQGTLGVEKRVDFESMAGRDPATSPRDAVWHSMELRNLTKHGLVVGSTGSGKTVTMTFLALEAVRNGIDVLVVEPIKAEYYDKFNPQSPENVGRPRLDKSGQRWRHPLTGLVSPESLRRFHFEADESEAKPGADHLKFDPMRLQPHITVMRHISYLKACFEAAFQLPEWLSVRVENALHEYYYGSSAGCGLKNVYVRGGPETITIRSRFTGFQEKKPSPPGTSRQTATVGRSHQLGVFPSLQTFCDFFLRGYLPRWTKQLGNSNRSGELVGLFEARFERLKNGPVGQAARLADAVVLAACKGVVEGLQRGVLVAENNVISFAKERTDEFQSLAGYSKATRGCGMDPGLPEDRWNQFVSIIPARARPKANPTATATAHERPHLGQINIVELEALADPGDKALVMALLLTFLYERRQAEDLEVRERVAKRYFLPPPPNGRPKHLLILEEAHRILAASAAGESGGDDVAGKTAGAKTAEMFTDMLAEIRALGQSIFIVEQIPKKLAPDAIKNTNLKLMHRTTSQPDREYMGSAMNFSEMQMEFVATLKPGQAVAFEENEDQPILLNMPSTEEWPAIFMPAPSEKVQP